MRGLTNGCEDKSHEKADLSLNSLYSSQYVIVSVDS